MSEEAYTAEAYTAEAYTRYTERRNGTPVKPKKADLDNGDLLPVNVDAPDLQTALDLPISHSTALGRANFRHYMAQARRGEL